LILDKIFPELSSPPDVVTVCFGANDAALPVPDGEKFHVPVPQYKANLHQIVSHIKSNSETTVVVLITPPPVGDEAWIDFGRANFGKQPEALPDRTNEVTKLYAQACKEVAKEADVPVIDLWSVFQQTQNWRQAYLCDGLHLTAGGNRIVFDELVNVLNGISFLRADKLPMDFPSFADIDPKNPGVAFQTWKNNANLEP
jgi:lysophospholipase L1-like esterase